MKDQAKVKERPILFSGPMVRAILEGRKTQTRRVVKPAWIPVIEASNRVNGYPALECLGYDIVKPYGEVGDRLWVRETFFIDLFPFCDKGPLPAQKPQLLIDHPDNLYYRADGECCEQISECCCGEVGPPRWRPSIHMPRWASRILLEVVAVRVERLLSISVQDVFAEGIECTGWGAKLHDGPPDMPVEPKTAYFHLWDAINGKGAHEANPWVWVIEFKQVVP